MIAWITRDGALVMDNTIEECKRFLKNKNNKVNVVSWVLTGKMMVSILRDIGVEKCVIEGHSGKIYEKTLQEISEKYKEFISKGIKEVV